MAPLTVPLAAAYGAIISARNRRYDRRGPAGRVDVPVISVGNITVGGVGKSPFVGWLVERLGAHGVRPAIALRGYGADRAGRSDEAAEHEARAADVPVIVDPDRLRAVRAALAARDDIDCVVLDDGFQHRRLHRDLDLVLVDASRPRRLERMLPAGWLREPASSLRRADGVIVTHAPDDSALRSWVERHHGRPPVAWCRHRWSGLDVHEGAGPARAEAVDWLAGRRVVTLLGVGHPEAVRREVRASGATIVRDVPAADHARHTDASLRAVRSLAAECEALLLTPKDWVKASNVVDLSDWPVPIVVPRLEMDVFAGSDDLLAMALAAVSPTS
jgi:tetraacyldisaccharide 4'-kinase